MQIVNSVTGGSERVESAIVTNIQGYSIHDGPGIRTVVFLKGCSLRCRWCANPENLSFAEQIGFISTLCKNCGRCMKTCRHGAIVPGEGVYRIDRDKCTVCFECLETCYYDALVRYGEKMTSEEVFDKVRRDKMFYDQSGGGVTVSGGEPLCHPGFVRELFESCRNEGINTCVETCGNVPEAAFREVLPLTDLFLFDLKLMNSAEHERQTGHGNEQILDNARIAAAEGKKVLFRQPLIPGINSSEENIAATAAFMRSLGEKGMDIQLMPYHRMGLSKYAALGQAYELEDIKIMDAEEINAAAESYRAHGVRCTVSK